MTDASTTRICTFNARYDEPDDEYPWDDRRSGVFEFLSDLEPDLIGCQEALAHQYDDLREGVADGYEFHGVGRQDGNREGEFVPVGWRRERFERLDTGAFWLSETPGEPSVGWDAALPRVTTWVLLRDRITGECVRFFNTHLDHRGERARLESARLLARRLRDRLADGETVVLTGDCNCTAGSPPYRTLTAGPMADARRVADDVLGPAGTFHGFTDGIGDRIDYVFVPASLAVASYRTVPRVRPPRSDHLPVVVECDLGSA